MRALLLVLLLHLAQADALDAAQQALDAGDRTQALRLLQAPATEGDRSAQWALAQLLELPGPTRDLKASLHWYGRLAQGGHAGAMEAIGLAHYLGRGAGQDFKQAAAWFRQAGERGELGSQYLLASMYEKGLGLPRDLRLAQSWYGRAAAQGDVAAAAKYEELERALNEAALKAPP
jgi:TPR repeat protein